MVVAGVRRRGPWIAETEAAVRVVVIVSAIEVFLPLRDLADRVPSEAREEVRAVVRHVPAASAALPASAVEVEVEAVAAEAAVVGEGKQCQVISLST